MEDTIDIDENMKLPIQKASTLQVSVLLLLTCVDCVVCLGTWSMALVLGSGKAVLNFLSDVYNPDNPSTPYLQADETDTEKSCPTLTDESKIEQSDSKST